MNRLALYVFWERNGDVHDHVSYYLRGLSEVARDVVVIVNGTLSGQGKKRLEALGVDFFVRENRGIDFAAWQAALARTGWEQLSRYDELVLCNSSCYGPMYPFSEMFRAMEGRACDFWGINRQPEVPEKILGDAGAPFSMKEHIQSYFYVFRQKVIRSEAFRNWWRNLVPAESYWEEVRDHEMAFSGYLEAHGFRSDTFLNADKYRKLAPLGDAWNICADVQLAQDRNPLVKRKALFAPTEASLRTWEHIRYHTSYPVESLLADYPKKEEFSPLHIIKYHLMTRLTSGEKKKRYSIKERKALFLSYLHLDLTRKKHA